MNIKFSIVMPAYNAAKYIASSIESVINQSYLNWELIIVNDASTDGTEDIVRRYMDSDSRIHLYTNTVSRKAGGSRNIGISHANGDYLMFLDSDDLYLPNLFRNVAAAIEEAEPDIIEFPYYESDANAENRHLPSWMPPYHKRKGDPKTYWMIHSTSVWCRAFKTALIRKYDLRNSERVKTGEDCLFSISSFFAADSLYFLDEPGYVYRGNSNSLTRSFACKKETRDMDGIVFGEIKDYLSDKGILDEMRFNLYLAHVYCNRYPFSTWARYRFVHKFLRSLPYTQDDFAKYGCAERYARFRKIQRQGYIKNLVACFRKKLRHYYYRKN